MRLMPETRTFDPDAPDPVSAAIRAAMGEAIRPTQPGAPASPVRHGGADASASGPSVGPPLATLGSFTFVAAPATAPKTDDDAIDDEG